MIFIIPLLKSIINLCPNFGFEQATFANIVQFLLLMLEYGKLFSLHRCLNA